MHDSANETLGSSLRNLVGKFYLQINLSIIFHIKNSVGSFFNFKDKNLNVFEATLDINIHVRTATRRISGNHPDIFIRVSLNTGVYIWS